MNDDFRKARFLANQAGSDTGSNSFASAEVSEPLRSSASPMNSVWWKWLATDSGTVTFDTGSSFDTIIAAYEGSSVDRLSLVSSNDDYQESSTSQLSFNAVAGNTYAIAVDGFENITGKVVLNYKLVPYPFRRPVNDMLENATLITELSSQWTGSNKGATGKANEPSHANSSAPLASVWWKWVANTTENVCFDTLGSDFNTTIAAYTRDNSGKLKEVASNDDFWGTSSLIWFNASAGQTYYLAVDGNHNAEGRIALSAKSFGQGAINEERIRQYSESYNLLEGMASYFKLWATQNWARRSIIV